MVNYFIYAKDFSDSTEGDEHYHSNGLKTLEQFKCDVEKMKQDLMITGEPPSESKIIYLHWGDYCWEVDENETSTGYLELKCGYTGAKPESIIQWLIEYDNLDKNYKIKLLYIVTGGVINDKSVQRCFKFNEYIQYEKVVFHAFNKDLECVNLAVAASFFKSHCMVYRNNEPYDIIDISQDFDYDKINVDNFAAEEEKLKSYIKLKFIRKIKQDTVGLQEIDKLKKLRRRLFDELSINSDKHAVNLDTKDKNIFLHEFVNTCWYKNLTGIVSVNKIYIEKSISTLINYIDSKVKSYSFDALKFGTKFGRAVKKEQIEDINFTEEQEIEFPDIILDDDKGIPVIILTTCSFMEAMIFHSKCTKTKCVRLVTPASFNQFKSAIDCPLFLMNDEYIDESIGYFYTLNVYKQLLANDNKTEPRTRRPFHGGLVLTDTDQFDKYNDYILSATYFEFKKVNYNAGLFYFTLWKICESKEWMDRNVVEQFKKYAMRRISETVCKIGLSSLPLDPPENTSLLTALWYCVELSSCIFKNDSQNFKHERLRMYPGVPHYMIEILKHFNYDLNVETIEKRLELINHVMALKRIQGSGEKFYYLLKKIFKTVDGFLVSEIENPCNLYQLNYLKLHHQEMLRDDVVEEKVNLNDYIHLMYFVDHLSTSKASEALFELSEKTFRPFFAIDKNKSFYTELFKITKKIVINNDDDKDKIEVTYEAIDSLEFDKMLSLYKMFMNCVEKLKKYPTFSEYIDYVSRRKKFNKSLVTIFPSNFYCFAKGVYEQYQKVITEVEVNKFIEVCKMNIKRTERIKAEERVKFSTDNEITEFISSEESKVNLIKKK